MRNHIIFFSGGKSSFAVADYVKTHFPNDNILLYFTDVLWEHEDLYRFIHEAADKLQLPMLTHSAGITPLQLMFEKKMIYNSRVADCSKLLKIKVARDYLKKGIVPPIEKWYNKEFLKNEDFKENPILYFGIGFGEMHRAEPIEKNWKPFEVQFPLIDHFIDNDAVLRKHRIKQPALYDMQFSHNNCNGRCVKAGFAHYNNLREKLPDVFQKYVEQEHYLKLYVSSYRYIKNIQSDGRDGWNEEVRQRHYDELDDAYRDYFYGRSKKPKLFVHPCFTASTEYIELKQYSFIIRKNETRVTRKSIHSKYKASTEHMIMKQYSILKRNGQPVPLSQFRFQVKKKKEKDTLQLDLFDIGGCGCFVDFSDHSPRMTLIEMN